MRQPFLEWTHTSKKLYYEYEFEDEGKTIKFKCINTAWMSQRKELQGELVYPISEIINNKTSCELVITLCHHPYPWLETENGREFRRRIEQGTDIILTGHEHDSTFTTQERPEGERNTYIEGGVLHSHDSQESDFNVLVIDTNAKKQKFLHASWSNGRYEPAKGTVFDEDERSLAWHEYQVNTLRSQERFTPNEETANYLEDPGANFSRKGAHVKLSDIYVAPDLRSIPEAGKSNAKHINGDKLVEFIQENNHVLIVGDFQSGKTAIGKYLYLSLNRIGNVPILIDAKKMKSSKSFDKTLEDIFIEQYQFALVEAFRQMDRNKRCIIIDDYHKLTLTGKKKKEFVSWLCDFAGTVILIADELTVNLSEISHPDSITDGGASFGYYVIQPFGYRRRDKLIKKWLARKIDPSQNTIDFARKLDSISKTLDTLIGKNYVPAYPIYIISVLYASDTATPIDLSASTHGYFYELIIKILIASGRTSIEYDVAASYLAHLAYQMFQQRCFRLSSEQYGHIHEEFQNKYEIKRSCEKMKDQLLGQHILIEHDGEYEFKYRFMYYYFVASYLRDNLSRDPRIKEIISELSDALYVEEYANIMLFLAHLSKDPFIIDEMINKAETVFDDNEPAKLEEDIEFLGKLESLTKLIIQEHRKEDLRDKILEEKDRRESELDIAGQYDEPVEEDIFRSSPLLQLSASLKTLEIMGQMLKNFPGSMEGPDKLKLTKSCYDLGLRTLAFTFNIIQGNEKELLKDFMKIIREQDKGFDDEKIGRKARESIVWVSQVIAFCMIKRISYAVGTPELFPIYEKIMQSPTTSIMLVDCSLAIDQATYFPDKKIVNLAKEMDKKWFPLEILRRIVALHLYLFEVPHNKRQRVCQALKIQYSLIQSPSTKRKLLKGK